MSIVIYRRPDGMVRLIPKAMLRRERRQERVAAIGWLDVAVYVVLCGLAAWALYAWTGVVL